MAGSPRRLSARAGLVICPVSIVILSGESDVGLMVDNGVGVGPKGVLVGGISVGSASVLVGGMGEDEGDVVGSVD